MNKTTEEKTKIAALADIHIRETSKGLFNELFAQISKEADVLVLCGDLTNRGLPSEAEILVQELKSCTIPIVVVLGNHDYDTGEEAKITEILTNNRITVLGDETFEFGMVGFAGVKGFGGGFDSHMLGSFGEAGIKNFVKEAVNEALQLENALGRLTTEKKIVAMHYSPIKETLIGEPEEIYSFLGSTRLEEPIDHFGVNVVFHGHAHFGSPEGKTAKGIPVYNVAHPLMQKMNADKPYRIVEV